MAYYDFMVEPFAKCIEAGFTKIDEVFPDDLKQKVIAFLASRGLGPDGKPLPVEEPEDSTTDDTKKEEKEEAKDEPKEPVEEAKEDEPSKDTKEEDKSPASEDKGAK